MCSNPLQFKDGTQVSCRECDECISRRKGDWIARCAAEKLTANFVYVLHLTYADNANGTTPDSAEVFNYKDVQLFLKKVRKAYKKHHEVDGEIRFVVAGEKGSQNGRVHWHMILFSQKDLSPLGTFKYFDKGMRRKKVVGLPVNERLTWSIWTHGFVMFQEPDERGFAYVLKYCIKDQFGLQKTEGKRRFNKADIAAAGMFRPSLQPPIGARWVEQELAQLRDKLAVKPNINIKIPGLRSYWYPRATLRKKWLLGFHEINEEAKKKRGKDCPQFSSLLHSLGDTTKDIEMLLYGDMKTEKDMADGAAWEEKARRMEARAKGEANGPTEWQRRQEHKRCGQSHPCKACYHGFSEKRRDQFWTWYWEQTDQFDPEQNPAKQFDIWFAKQTGKNPFCTVHGNAPF